MATETTKFENRVALMEKTFNRGWALKLCKEGEGYSIRLAQFNGEVSSQFTFYYDKAVTIFNDTSKVIGHK